MNTKDVNNSDPSWMNQQKLKSLNYDFDSGLIDDCDISSNLSVEIESVSEQNLDKESNLNIRCKLSGSSTDFQTKKCVNNEEDSGIIRDIPDDDLVPEPKFQMLRIKEKLKFTDEDGNTELHLAVMRKDEKNIECILHHISDSSFLDLRNFCGQTSLHLSVLVNCPKITRLLYLAGAKADIEDMYGNTALHSACSTSNFACTNALLSPMSSSERTISFPYKVKHDDISKCLNEYNYNGLSCLHLAVGCRNYKIFQQLLSCGADINIKELKGGHTTLHEAVIKNDKVLVNYILQHPYIDVNRKTYARKTAFQLSSGSPEIRQLLLDKMCDPYESNSSDYSDSDSDSELSTDE